MKPRAMKGLKAVVVMVAIAFGDVSALRRDVQPASAPDQPPPPAAKLSAAEMCKKLCQEDAGTQGADLEDCLAECKIYTDTSESMEDAAGDFVKDESFNDKGGEAMAEEYENVTKKDVPSCVPSVDVKREPTFKELDTDGDGHVTKAEAIAWGNKACVPDEMVKQLFIDTDANRDKVIDEAEWGASGEDTQVEKQVDETVDDHTEGDDEYHEVELPPFEAFDLNDDGLLQESEVFDAFMFELKKRIPEVGKQQKAKIIRRFKNKVAEDFQALDLNGDGMLGQDEYYQKAKNGDMGDELSEAAVADEDAEDPAVDSDPATPSAAAASLLSERFKLAENAESQFLSRFKPQKVTALRQAKVAVIAKADRVPSKLLVQLWHEAETAMGMASPKDSA